MEGTLSSTLAAILRPIAFRHPRRITASAWDEHIPFAMSLTDLLRPSCFVELGTYRGASYCAFCQAVAELSAETRCYAVDTWRGDPHGGEYGDEVLADLRAHHDPLYAGFSALVQSTFAEALRYFDDGSVDLLHIDGFHTFDAVKQDYESWLPKMSRRGVVLFHDTNVREKDFGVRLLWRDLSAHHPHFEFVHGHGLGVLAVGDSPESLRPLLEANERDATLVRLFFSELGRHLTREKALQAATAEREQLKAAVEGGRRDIGDLKGALSARDATIEELRGTAEASVQEVSRQIARARLDAGRLENVVASLSAEVAARTEALEVAERGARTLRAEIAAAQADAETARRELRVLEASHSWRMTRPLRRLMLPARKLASSRSFRQFLWESGKAAVAALPEGPREAVRDLKRKVITRPPKARADLDNERVATGLKRALRAIAAERPTGQPITHVLVVPFLRSGGADLTATYYLRALAARNGPASCLLVVADSPDLAVPDWLPVGVSAVRIDDFIDGPDKWERLDLLDGLVRATSPRVLHTVNSVVGWDLVIFRGAELSRIARLFGSIFAFQYLADGKLMGYAAEFFEGARPHLTGLLTDNARFARDLAIEYKLDPAWQRRVHVVYNPSRALRGPMPAPTLARAPDAPLRVLWAGRADAEKLPEVLQAVSERAQFATFDVFGSTVVDGGAPRLVPHERLHLRGPFHDLATLFANGSYDAFLFTSKWEGMPNVVLEIGAYGIPVIAPDVGGVPELIREDTGYLVRGARNVGGYIEALEAIRRDPREAALRAARLASLVRERHSWEHFAETLMGIPDYA